MNAKISAGAAFAIASALLGGCAAKDVDAVSLAASEQKSYNSIPAPTRADIATRIAAADAGKTVEIKIGSMVAVELVGVPTAGYLWTVAEAPAFLKKAGETGGPTSEAQLQPGFSGGNHWEVFFFEATGGGEGVLRFEQRRIWDEEGPADDSFSVTVKAQ